MLTLCARYRSPLSRTLALLLALLALSFVRAGAQELQQKAAHLLHCCRYVEWPAAAFTDPSAPLVIGIAGNDPFGAVLDSTVRGHFVKGRRVLVRRFGAQEPSGCHLLFVSDTSAAPLQAVQGRPVLTVSDAPDFIAAGGMIRFVPERGKVRLLVRPAAVRASGLNISSKLLRLVKIID